MVHEAVLQLGFELILVATRTAELHGPHMGLGRDIGRRLHDLLLAGALVQTHVVQQVIQRDKLLRRLRAQARLAANQVDPVGQPAIKFGVGTHGVIDALAAFNQPGQNIVDITDGERVIGAVLDDRALLPGTIAVPQFALLVLLAAEQHIFAVLAAGNQNSHGLRLREAGEILKIAVLAVVVLDITVTDKHLGRRQHGNAVGFHLVHQRLATAGIFLLADSHLHLNQCSAAGGASCCLSLL